MTEPTNKPHSTLALSTKLEEDFVSPLTAMRGALEILRDFPELTRDERARFIDTALRECARLERGVGHLGDTVYAAAQRAPGRDTEPDAQARHGRHMDRIHVLEDLDVIEVDLSDLEFSSSKMVNDFYDALEMLIEGTARSWYFVVNYRDCRIWPEAWVAFAHRGKRVNENHGLGSVRYVERPPGSDEEASGKGASVEGPDVLPSREQAFARVAELRRNASAGSGPGMRRAR